MNKFNSIADFKRAMQVGSVWHTTHQFIGDHPSPVKDKGIRTCSVHQSNSFAFKNPVTGENSWSDWPKKTEFSCENETVIITRDGFCQLKYTLVQEV